jgi:hypothetical protein
MNERIKQLAEQAGSTHKQNLGVYQFYKFELENFAELIVRECSSIIESQDVDPAFKNRMAWAIKDRFGVE